MRIIDFLVCDDVRQEIGNKVTLVGVYGDRVILNPGPDGKIQWPILFKLGSYIRLWLEEDEVSAEPWDFQLKLSIGEKPLFSAEGKLTVGDKSRIMSLPLVAQALIPQAGILTYSLRVFRGDEVFVDEDKAFSLEFKIGS